VIHGTKIVEIRNTSVHKGIAAANLAQEHGADFILAIGDDWTDEDMFKSLPANAHTIKVGLSPSCAKYRLSTPEAVLDFLNGLGECRNLTVSSTY
jgi:trehalose 6-phosphate synthase/phosphatase